MSKQELSIPTTLSFLRVAQVGFGCQPTFIEHWIFARHWWLKVFDLPLPPPPPPKKRGYSQSQASVTHELEDLEIHAYLSLPPSAQTWAG